MTDYFSRTFELINQRDNADIVQNINFIHDIV